MYTTELTVDKMLKQKGEGSVALYNKETYRNIYKITIHI